MAFLLASKARYVLNALLRLKSLTSATLLITEVALLLTMHRHMLASVVFLLSHPLRVLEVAKPCPQLLNRRCGLETLLDHEMFLLLGKTIDDQSIEQCVRDPFASLIEPGHELLAPHEVVVQLLS